MAARVASLTLQAVVVLLLSFTHANAQNPLPSADDKGLLPMIPPDAIFFVEHRGHTAVHDAFAKSNLGKMYEDPAIQKFVQDSRVRIGKMIMKSIFESANVKTDPAELQQTLHKVTKAFWYRPAAMYAVLQDGQMNEPPGLGLICEMDEKSRAEAKPALDSLAQIGVPSAGMGVRQAFKWKTGKLEWSGVALAHSEWQQDPSGNGGGKMTRKEWLLPADAQLQAKEFKSKTLFLTCWTDKYLLVATSLSAAEAMGNVFAKPDGNKDKNAALARVLKKTSLKEWAFRWYLDLDLLEAAANKKAPGKPFEKFYKKMGMTTIHGLGGTGGYADNVFTRLTYVDAPKSGGGVFGIFKLDGDYTKSLDMMPRSTTFLLAGQFDKARCLDLIRRGMTGDSEAAAGPAGAVDDDVAPRPVPPGDAPKGPKLNEGATPATKPAGESKLSEQDARVLAQIEKLLDATNGHVGLYVTDLKDFEGMFGGGGVPVGLVLEIKDKAKAVAAIEDWVKLSGEQFVDTPPTDDEGDAPGGAPGSQPAAAEYRKVKIRFVGRMFRMGVLEDRVIIALGKGAFESAVDAALNHAGAPNPGSEQARLLKLCGNGPAVFSVDLAKVASYGWPKLVEAGADPNDNENMPFTSLPTTEKLVALLGPEVVVFQPDKDGLLLKSRGKIPFATKFTAYFPAASFVPLMIMRGL